jgi:protein gp37
MANTSIEWATKVWNPLRGCSKVSEGCHNCYAMRQAHRFSGQGMPYEGLTRATEYGPQWTGNVKLVPDMLVQPLKWQRPERIFVNSMSDLFHQEVPDDFIWSVFEIMAQSQQHTFQILTKRPERMKEMLTNRFWRDLGTPKRPFFARIVKGEQREGDMPCLPNVWLGVSVENQKSADERIPLLLQTQAAIRFLSMEPLLGHVDLSAEYLTSKLGSFPFPKLHPIHRTRFINLIDWVIVGGESGHKARPMHPDWVRSIRDQCQEAGVPFFFKQNGEWVVGRRMQEIEIPGIVEESRNGIITLTTIDPPQDVGKRKYAVINNEGKVFEMVRVGKKAAGRMLDGREWNEYPEVRK